MTALDTDLGAFTLVLHYCRPHMRDYEVFELAPGHPSNQSLWMRARSPLHRGDVYSFVIAKEWIMENLDRILQTVPEDPEDDNPIK